MDLLGQGTYGKVFKARHNETGELVAIKKIKMEKEKEGFPITAIREINILKTLKHKNIVELKNVHTTDENEEFFMVFEYVEHDLAGLIESNITFSEAQIKSLMKQLLEGIAYFHEMSIMHRDIKSSNLLINNNGKLKIADFGLSRFYTKKEVLTNRVVTRWYRPPELFFGDIKYTSTVDLWSIGCILGELLTKKVLFPAPKELEQLDTIFLMCGTPNKENWPKVNELPNWGSVQPKYVKERILKEHFKSFPSLAVDLLDKFLALDPLKRITASDALKHEWFSSEPLPQYPTNLPIINCNELYVKEKKRKSAENINLPSKKIKYEYDNNNFKKYNYKNEDNYNQKEYNNGNRDYKNFNPEYKKKL